jgi:DNA-binding CsgD family transcriptional regulator
VNSINQAEITQSESSFGIAARKIGEPVGLTLGSLSSLLRNSTIGVALFDRNLNCKTFNDALRSTLGVSPRKHGGKPLQKLLPGGFPKLELAFRRVWNTGNPLSNVELSAQLPPGSEPRKWLVNFYPVRDETGQVRFVAATFSEVTKGRCVELKLSRLRDKFRSDMQRKPNLVEEEFSALSARTFELVNRSVTLLRASMSLRFYTSEMQLEAVLVRHALFIDTSRPQESLFRPQPLDLADAASAVNPESHESDNCAASSPSPRERQILHLLSDGKSNKEIGSILDISTRTVECYRARIMLKLDLHSTAALVRYAIRNKIVEA